MNINIPTQPEKHHSVDPAVAEYWACRGSKTAAFLLVIPGAAVVGLGFGMLTGHMTPYTVIGSGAGLLLWGLIVALSK
jgi:hypothetical protein